MVYPCRICNTDLDTISGLCTHIRFLHPHSILSPFSCGNCDREYGSLKSLREHLHRIHPQRENPPGDNDNLHYNLNDNFDQNAMEVDMVGDEEVRELDLENEVRAQNDQEISVLDFKSALYKSALSLSAKLYSHNTLNRLQVQEIINLVCDFTASGFLDVLKQKTLLVLGEVDDHNQDLKDLNEMFDATQDAFAGLSTEHQRINALERSDAFIRPQSYIIGVGEQVKYIDGAAVLTPIELTGQFISMKKVLKQFLELPGVLRDTLNNIENLKNNREFTNIIQSPLWRDIEETHFQNRMVLPLFLYYDDAEPDNQCGSHSGKHKLGAVYYQIPCIPQHLTSSLENIFVASVFLSADRNVNNEAAFRPVLNEIRDLETNGILVETDDNEYQIYFALIFILGDNLGIHTISGFVESFSANFFCRFCKVHRNDAKRLTRENVHLLRNTENYLRDVQLNDYTLTGIKRECMWNILSSYHVISNAILDMMHDFFDGVCHYDLSIVLFELISLGYFSLQTLNERIQYFDYGFDSGNKLSVITVEHLRNRKLKMSASEMYFFVRHLGLMVGDLVPENNEVWKLYLILAEILDIIAAPFVRINSSAYLATLISEHHEIYCNVFNQTLKPKHHFMLHYPRIMNQVGPIIHMWCMRMEGKHRPVIKQTAKAHTSRKNLPLTTVLRYTLGLCARVLARRGFPKEVSFHPLEKHLRDLHYFDDFQNILPPGYENSIIVENAEICGILYRRDMVLAINYENELPLFAIIKWVVKPLEVNQKAWFLLTGLNTLGLSEHLHCYEVRPTAEWFCVAYEDLISFYPMSKCRTGGDGCTYITFKHVL